MTFLQPVLFSFFALCAAPALAQQSIVAPSPASSPGFDLYATPDSAEPARRIAVAEAGLPLPVQAREGGFLKVEIGGQPYWMRSAKVRVSRGSTANCTALALAAPRAQTASTPGASNDACK